MYYCPRCEKPSPTRNCPQCGDDLLSAREKEYIEQRYLDEQGPYPRKEDGSVKIGGWMILFVILSILQIILWAVSWSRASSPAAIILCCVNLGISALCLLLLLGRSRGILYVLWIFGALLFGLGLFFYITTGYFVTIEWLYYWLWALYFTKSNRAFYTLPKREKS